MFHAANFILRTILELRRKSRHCSHVSARSEQNLLCRGVAQKNVKWSLKDFAAIGVKTRQERK